jgi:uncharacterized protein YndB with AHSA1/START domain
VSVTERVIPATPDRVFAVLSDGWTYSDWVVGAAHVRDVDASWPAPGSLLHHKSGPWPLSLNDSTTVLECEPDRMLLLRVRIWPFGEAEVRIELAPADAGSTRVRMTEHFVHGPLHVIQNKLNHLLLHRRNVEALRRLSDFAVNRWAVTAGSAVDR